MIHLLNVILPKRVAHSQDEWSGPFLPACSSGLTLLFLMCAYTQSGSSHCNLCTGLDILLPAVALSHTGLPRKFVRGLETSWFRVSYNSKMQFGLGESGLKANPECSADLPGERWDSPPIPPTLQAVASDLASQSLNLPPYSKL